MKKFSAITIAGVIILFCFYFLKTKSDARPNQPDAKPQVSTSSIPKSDKPEIVSTKPDPLDETIIPADQIIEISFNRPLQNVPEFKVKFEPKIDFKVELSSDRKTAKITPAKPFGLGSEYTLSIAPDTKFDGVGNWGMDKSFHFRTIKYRGI